ncbi:MAG: hypothetical protein KIS95_13375 [Anaerolineae bacterium]|uniref:hypothetical protein n=1 Tax=Promineifilum sp. TaxID=2664178 RepID=UPI001D3B0E88|nr:hypothetical protein [Anaerolineales bacterium]MCO5179312.1 hypothetical protein [Promineifilum sp.]MCW5848220.1 hypothetical protein [Anaerolineae bacterium]
MTPTILVITGERDWTRRAIHLAAAMAQEAKATILLAHMAPITHLEYLGGGNGDDLLTYTEYDALCECATTAEEYGVGTQVEIFEYTDYSGGLKSAADQASALAVFAPAPDGPIGALRRARLWLLRRTLGRPLYTLGHGDGPLTWTEPSAAPRPAVVPMAGVKRL